MADFWTKHTEITSVDKNKKEVIKAFSCERQDKEYVEIRIFTRENEEDTDCTPTKKGVVIPKEMWGELSKAIDDTLIDEI